MTVAKNKALTFIFITILIDVIGLGIIIPVVPELLHQLTGAGMSKVATYGSILLTSYGVMQFFCSPIMGALSDRFGRRPVLLLSLLGLGIDYIFHALAPSFVWLIVGRLIAGVMGASFTTATAYIADISTPEKRAQNFGLIGVAFGVGFMLGPVIGGQCGALWGPRAPFYMAAAFSLLNCLYGYFVLPESLPKENRRKFEWKRANPVGSLAHLKKYPVVSGLIASLVLVYLAAHAVQSNWAYFTMLRFNWTEAMVGNSLGFVGLLVAIVQGGLIRVVIPKLGQKKSVYVGMLFYATGLLLFAFASESWMMYAFLIPYCLGGIAGPALQGIISSQVPPNEQGELQGAITSLMSLTNIFGPLIMNNLFAYYTGNAAPFYFPGAAFLLGAGFTFISTWLAMVTLKHFKQPVYS